MNKKERIETQSEFKKTLKPLRMAVQSIQVDAKVYPNYAAAKKIVHLYDEKTAKKIRRQARRATCVMSEEQWNKEFHRQILPGAQAIQIKKTFWQEETSEQEKRDSAAILF